jgi:hypothetical protein
MRKRALLWLVGLAVVALALLLTDALLWRPGLTVDNVRRIRPGPGGTVGVRRTAPGGSRCRPVRPRKGHSRDVGGMALTGKQE